MTPNGRRRPSTAIRSELTKPPNGNHTTVEVMDWACKRIPMLSGVRIVGGKLDCRIVI